MCWGDAMNSDEEILEQFKNFLRELDVPEQIIDTAHTKRYDQSFLSIAIVCVEKPVILFSAVIPKSPLEEFVRFDGSYGMKKTLTRWFVQRALE